MRNNILVPIKDIPELTKDELNSPFTKSTEMMLDIDVKYELGGGYRNRRRGVYVYFKPTVIIHEDGYTTSREIINYGTNIKVDGFCGLLEQLNRKSQKKVDYYHKKAEEAKQKIAELWNSMPEGGDDSSEVIRVQHQIFDLIAD